MRIDPEAIRAQISAIAEQLQAIHRRLLTLVEELESQVSELPEAVLDHLSAQPLEYHHMFILRKAEEYLGSTIEILCRIVDLNEAEMAARWKEERQDELYTLAKAAMHDLSTVHIWVSLLAVRAHNGLPDEEIPGVVAALLAVREAAREALEPGRGLRPLAMAEEEEEEEARHEGEKP